MKKYPAIFKNKQNSKETEFINESTGNWYIQINEANIVLPSGESDCTTIWKEEDYIYILAINYRLRYIGISRINFDLLKKQIYEEKELFLQTDYEIENFQEFSGIKKDVFSLSEKQICIKMANYLAEVLS